MTTARYARIVCLADVNNVPNAAAGEFTFLDATDTPFSPTGWTISASSENDTPGNDYRALYAFDGSTIGSFWHTLFDGAEPGHPHWVDIDFGASLDVRKVQYAPRPSGSNGNVTRFQVYLRAAGSTDWEPYMHSPVVTGDFAHALNPSGTFAAVPTANTAGVQYVGARRKRNGAGDATCTRPPDVNDGDYVVLWIWGLGSNDTPTLVDDAVGFTLLERHDNGVDQFIAAYGGFVGSGDASWGATTSGYTSLAACFYRNVDTTTPVAATADGSGTSDSPIAPSVTASAADSMLLVSTMGTASGFTGTSGASWSSGLVQRIADLDTTIEAFDELVGSGATGTRTVVMGAASQSWLAVSLVLNPATGDGDTEELAGTSAGAGSASGVLVGSASLSGLAAGTGSPAAALTGRAAVAGAAAGTGSATASLRSAMSLSGVAAGSCSLVGPLVGRSSLAGTAAGSAAATGNASGRAALSGAASGSATPVAALTTNQSNLAGTAAGAGSATSSLVGRAALSGAAAGVATPSADLSIDATVVELSGVAAGNSAQVGALSGTISLSGATTGGAIATADVAVSMGLAGASAGSGSADAALRLLTALAGESTGAASVVGLLRGFATLAGTASGLATPTALLLASAPITYTSLTATVTLAVTPTSRIS